jgi:hypothetical protein
LEPLALGPCSNNPASPVPRSRASAFRAYAKHLALGLGQLVFATGNNQYSRKR